MTLRPRSLFAVALLACGTSSDAEEAPTYDDRAERAALVEGRGYAFVGFVPVTGGIDGLATVQPRAFTVHEGAAATVIEVTRRFQQGPVTVAMNGSFTNGFVEGHDVTVLEPRISSESSFDGLRTQYWFEDGRAMGQMNATIFTSRGRLSSIATRAAGADQRALTIQPDLAFPVDAQPYAQAIAYAYRSGPLLGVSVPIVGGGPPARVETTAGQGRAISLAITADGDLRVAATEARDADVFLSIHRRAGATLERVAEMKVEAEIDGAPLRVLHSASATYVAVQPPSTAARLYRVDGGTLAPVAVPPGERHTFALAEDGALYIGFSDPAAEGRATVQRLAGDERTTIGQPGFSRDAVTAHVFPRGPDVYVAFTSTKEVAGAAIACAGPSCVAYQKKVLPTGGSVPSTTTTPISCSYEGDTCREATGTTPKGVEEFSAWCARQSAPTYRTAACPREGVVGACRKSYNETVVELSWSYGNLGKTSDLVERACKATGTEFVPPP